MLEVQMLFRTFARSRAQHIKHTTITTLSIYNYIHTAIMYLTKFNCIYCSTG